MHRTSVLSTATLLFGAVLAVVACDKKPMEEPPPPGLTYTSPELVPGYLPKCPRHLEGGFEMVVDTGLGGEPQWKLITVPSIPLSGNLGAAPEAHDCQRLVVGHGRDRSFGPLAVIFAADSLWLPPATSPGSNDPERAVATIYAYPTGYDPLNIAPGLNCLYIYSPGPEVIQARMVRASVPDDCLKPLSGRGKVLAVRRDPDAGPPEEIPAVARWDGDFENGGDTHHIGIRCGDYWCEVGQPGFSSAPHRHPGQVPSSKVKPSGTAPSAAERARIVRNRGYYDEQLLAVKSGTGPLSVGPVVATLLPNPFLDSLESAADFEEGWINVATAYLPQDVTGYKEKMNLEGGVNEIYLRLAARATVVGDGATIAKECDSTDAAPKWWILVQSARTKERRVYCGSRFSHEGKIVGLPAAVRWQWLENDEKTWFPCGGGCCTQN